MSEAHSGQVVIAGAGVAGLTAGLAFAARGYGVRIFERAPRIEEVGAGLQLSPNATRILDRLGVLPLLLPAAIRPEAVVLRDAKSLAELARVPLGDAAERRWKAPYLTIHRADLQSALLARVQGESGIDLVTGAEVRSIAIHADGVVVSIDKYGATEQIPGLLAIGADGVWSSTRAIAGVESKSIFAGQTAWRSTIKAGSTAGQFFRDIGATGFVTAFLHPGFHLIVYPVRSGAAYNLVAFTPGAPMARTWSGKADASALEAAMSRTDPALSRLAEDGAPWTVWPVHTVNPMARWTVAGGIALIGDAAHAMTPFAAQGAAMAIEDAETLASHVAANPFDIAVALAAWEKERRPRIARVLRRGKVNHLAWHAAGPVALARNLFLKARSPESLAADLDWLYGWEPPQSTSGSIAQA